jgi:type IV pilus assembly protein PilB
MGFAKHLIEQNLLDEKTLKKIFTSAINSNETLITQLSAKNFLDNTILAKTISHYFKIPFIDLEQLQYDETLTNLLPPELIQKHLVLPLEKKGENLYLALYDPTDTSTLSAVRFHTNLNLKLAVAANDQLQKIIKKIVLPKTSDTSTNEDDSIIKHLDQILKEAINKQSSDIHFEPYNEYYRIRFRIDGLLYEIIKIDLHLGQRYSSRLKIMANLDIAEKRLPQDGRFTLKLINHQNHDCRLSTCPTLFGEKLVVRILSPINAVPNIRYLGLDKKELKIFFKHIKLPQGMILVTGPTGSGKTITLYTAINILNQSTKNISTAEDPVEINLNGINQIEINHKIGLDFATVLRAFLRQDPDIIMIGEIRDRETAEIAIKAAHTGHLVLATLHTNSATASLTRLLNMGIPSFNLATALKLIIAQRLVRKLCLHCKQPQILPIITLRENKLEENKQIFSAVGCKSCNQGYHGRMAIFEMLQITPDISNLLIKHCDTGKIEKYLHLKDHQNLRAAALNKVRSGFTSLEEINRVVT